MNNQYKNLRPTVLMVKDKYCEATIANGLSEWEGNIFDSLESTGLAAEIISFNFDQYWFQNQRRGDEALIALCKIKKISFIILVVYREPGSHFSVIRYDTLEKIKNELNIQVIAIWGDIQQPYQISLANSLLPYVSFNVCTASSATVAQLQPNNKYFYYWVPKDPRIFNDPRKKRDILISYVGSPKPERLEAVKKLKNSGINVYSIGGERHDHLNISDYAEILKRSKITLGFSRSSGYHVINARVFEATLCGALLLEEEGVETPQMFTPFEDYVPYTSLEDLVDKAKYYLANENSRNLIAASGSGKCHVRYSAQSFWKSVIDRVLSNQK